MEAASSKPLSIDVYKRQIVEAGLKVPDDVSLVGFDNWDMSGYSDMHLTTVERNMGEIAREGARAVSYTHLRNSNSDCHPVTE